MIVEVSPSSVELSARCCNQSWPCSSPSPPRFHGKTAAKRGGGFRRKNRHNSRAWRRPSVIDATAPVHFPLAEAPTSALLLQSSLTSLAQPPLLRSTSSVIASVRSLFSAALSLKTLPAPLIVNSTSVLAGSRSISTFPFAKAPSSAPLSIRTASDFGFGGFGGGRCTSTASFRSSNPWFVQNLHRLVDHSRRMKLQQNHRE